MSGSWRRRMGAGGGGSGSGGGYLTTTKVHIFHTSIRPKSTNTGSTRRSSSIVME